MPGFVRSLLVFGVLTTGCRGQETWTVPPPTPIPGSGSGPSVGVPPTLTANGHPGFTNPNCQNCHALPVERHTVSDRTVCAQCHGANGACFPNGHNAGKNDHTADDNCVACHSDPKTGAPGQHGFTQTPGCANCHFREVGQRACEDVVWVDLPDAGVAPPLGVPPVLSQARVTNCFNFPAQPFSKNNSVADGEEWVTKLKRGDKAVDFTLFDTAGNAKTLSALLANGPVWLQSGSLTCPVYQNAVALALNPLTHAADDAGVPFAQQIQFVHVYTVEAHPKNTDFPDYSPYNSARQFPVSTVHQPKTYADRLANAKQMEPKVEGETMLVDALDSSGGSNVFWCTYGTCPACSYLVGRDGFIHAVIERTPDSMSDLSAVLGPFLKAQQ